MRSNGCSRPASLLRGEFRPGGAEREWCDPEVLRLLRRRSLARLRREVEPVDPAALGALPARLAGRGRRSARAPGRRSAARPPSSGSPRSSTSWPACRSRRRCSSATSCPRGSPATSRACSTSSGRSARSPGWGGGASAATTGGSPSSGPAARSCGRPGRPDGTEPPTRAAPRRDPRAPGRARRLVLSRAVRRGPRRLGSRGARRAVGPGLGRRGHQRHVRAAPGAALEADRERRRAGNGGRRAADRARTARGGRPLVARRRRRPRPATPTERLHAQSLALLERHGVVTREAVATEGDRGRVRRRLPGPAGDGGGRPDPARLLRRRPRGRPVRAGRRARPAAGRARAGRSAGERRGPPAGRRRPGQPVRRRAAVAAPRRDDRRPLQRAAGAYVVLVDGDRGALPRARRGDAPDAARRRRPGRGGHRGPRPRARSSPTAASASSSSARSTARTWRSRRSARSCSRRASSPAIAASSCASRSATPSA